MKLRIAGMVVAALFTATASAHADLVTNGGFETGDFTGWNAPADGGYSFVYSAIPGTTYVPHTGDYEALLGTFGTDGTLSQTIADTAGQTLVLTYWLASDGATNNNFSALWNGNVIAGSALSEIPYSGYTEYTFDVRATGSDLLAFDEEDDGGWLSLDDVSLSQVPEPGSLALLGAGLAGFAASRRRKVRKAS